MYNNIIRQRQIEARIALRLEKMSEEGRKDVVKTDNGYEWKDEKGNTLVSVTMESL